MREASHPHAPIQYRRSFNRLCYRKRGNTQGHPSSRPASFSSEIKGVGVHIRSSPGTPRGLHRQVHRQLIQFPGGPVYMGCTSCERSKHNQGPSSFRPARLSFRSLFTGALRGRACVPSLVFRPAQLSLNGSPGFLPYNPPALQGFGTLFDIPFYLVF